VNSLSILSNAVSGMRESSLQLQATANNIVNAGLSNYKKIQVRDTVPKPNSIPDNIKYTPDISPKLVNEMVNLIQIQHSHTANAKVVQASEELVGSLLDIMVLSNHDDLDLSRRGLNDLKGYCKAAFFSSDEVIKGCYS
jgi:flagellar basal body rod protein FlgC